jgi:hypothetical protein
LIEQYIPRENIWKTISIDNTPSLGAFSWCVAGRKLIVLGGTDGNLLSSDIFELSFKDRTCEYKPSNFEFSTGMGHLLFRSAQNELYHIGGFNSDGTNYSCQMSDLEWDPLTSAHSIVTNSCELELTQHASVYYP